METGSETVPLSQYQTLEKDYQGLQQRLALVEHELARLKKMVFGKKSERYIPENSAQMALELEGVDQKPDVPTSEEVTYSRSKSTKKGQAKRLFLPANLPRHEEVIEPDDVPEGSQRIGEHITEVLEYNPGKIYVRRIVRCKYVAPAHKEALNTRIHIGDLPDNLPLPKSNVGAGLLAHLMVSKYADHLPFYRQVKMFKREGIPMAEATMHSWFSNACRVLKPLYEVLHEQLSQTDYLQADETGIPVLSKNKPGSTHQGYLWVYRIPKNGTVYFDYQQRRSKDIPDNALQNFEGTLQTDGYKGYNQVAAQSRIRKHLACMAHARRQFVDSRGNDAQRANEALNRFKQLYDIERYCDNEAMTAEARQKHRYKYAKPVLDALHQWLKEQYEQVLPQSPIGKAIGYSLNLWSKLSAYIEDGRWEIDNNRIENTIRPVALGRKNYLFAGSHEGAERAAMMYSFLGTCQAYGVNPYEWFKHVLENIRQTRPSQMHTLLPGQKKN